MATLWPCSVIPPPRPRSRSRRLRRAGRTRRLRSRPRPASGGSPRRDSTSRSISRASSSSSSTCRRWRRRWRRRGRPKNAPRSTCAPVPADLAALGEALGHATERRGRQDHRHRVRLGGRARSRVARVQRRRRLRGAGRDPRSGRARDRRRSPRARARRARPRAGLHDVLSDRMRAMASVRSFFSAGTADVPQKCATRPRQSAPPPVGSPGPPVRRRRASALGGGHDASDRCRGARGGTRGRRCRVRGARDDGTNDRRRSDQGRADGGVTLERLPQLGDVSTDRTAQHAPIRSTTYRLTASVDWVRRRTGSGRSPRTQPSAARRCPRPAPEGDNRVAVTVTTSVQARQRRGS